MSSPRDVPNRDPDAPPAKRRAFAFAILVVAWVVVSTVGLCGRSTVGDRASVNPADPVAGASSSSGGSELPIATVEGQVFVEVAAAGSKTSPDEDAGDDEPVVLRPPQDLGCTVVAWQRGHQVSDPGRCDERGRYAFPLAPGTFGPTTFELLVPGRLRAVVDVDVPEGGRGRLPAVALGVGQTVSGQVVDGRGAPVDHATIEAMPVPSLGEAEPWRAVADASGRFTLDTLPPGPVTLRATKPGFNATVVEAIAPQTGVLVRLEALFVLRGRVAGPPSALTRTRLRLEGSGIWPAREVTVAADGTFAFEDVPDGIYAIEAVASTTEGALHEFASVPLENVTPDVYVTLALIDATRLKALVLNPAGQPVGHARVTVGNSHVGLLQRVAVAGEDGTAELGPLVPGTYVLRADAEGYLPAAPVSLGLAASGTPVQRLVLGQPGRIEGTVVDETGAPVAGAVVLVEGDALYTPGAGQARAQTFRSALLAAGTLGVTQGPVPKIPDFDSTAAEPRHHAPRTDAAGRFMVPGIAGGTYRLTALHGGYARSRAVSVRVRTAAVRRGIQLVLRTGALLTGRVVDGNDQPIPGVTVRVDRDDVVRTDRTGVFDAGYRRGLVGLRVSAPGLMTRELDVAINGAPRDVTIVLLEADGVLQGRTDGPNGQPIEDVQVRFAGGAGLAATRIAWSDARGLYRLEGLSTGPAKLTFEHPGYLAAERSVVVGAGSDPVDVTLVEGWSAAFDVRSEGTGTPLANASIVAQGRLVRTDRKGQATLGPLAGSQARATVQAAGHAPYSTTVSRPARGRFADVVIELTQGGGLSGRVIDDLGDPVGGARVVVTDVDTEEILAQTRTSTSGRWSVDGLREGDVTVEATPPAGLRDQLASVAQRSDVLRGHVTRGVDLRFDRQ